MTEHSMEPNLEDVIDPAEEPHPDHREHAKTPHPLDDDELERRAAQERQQTGADGPVQGR